VSPDNEAMGEAILEAQFGANGATNTSYNKAELVVNEFLDGPEWFLANVNGMARPMIFQEERATKFSYWTADTDYSVMQRKEFLYEAYGVYTVNYGLPQRIIGSTGADA
jgi:phage major head subunit gpT-like protein